MALSPSSGPSDEMLDQVVQLDKVARWFGMNVTDVVHILRSRAHRQASSPTAAEYISAPLPRQEYPRQQPSIYPNPADLDRGAASTAIGNFLRNREFAQVRQNANHTFESDPGQATSNRFDVPLLGYRHSMSMGDIHESCGQLPAFTATQNSISSGSRPMFTPQQSTSLPSRSILTPQYSTAPASNIVRSDRDGAERNSGAAAVASRYSPEPLPVVAASFYPQDLDQDLSADVGAAFSGSQFSAFEEAAIPWNARIADSTVSYQNHADARIVQGPNLGTVATSPTDIATYAVAPSETSSHLNRLDVRSMIPGDWSHGRLPTPADIASAMYDSVMHSECSHLRRAESTALDSRQIKRKRANSHFSTGQFEQRRRPARPRSSFPDNHSRETTARTREVGACIRCRMQRKRCEPDTSSPCGPCKTCQKLLKPQSKFACLRVPTIKDVSTYREQDAPNRMFTRRWKTLDLIDIESWASNEVRSIEVSQMIVKAPYRLRVRKFTPVEADVVSHEWTDPRGDTRCHHIPEYAIANMEEMVLVYKQLIEQHNFAYVKSVVRHLPAPLWATYIMAFRRIKYASDDKERDLLKDTIRLWTSCRKISNSEQIVGEETLGGQPLNDPTSRKHLTHPLPPVIRAQAECIMFTKLLKPFSKRVLNQLQEMVLANDKRYWLSIYLTIFILLHSCSLMTRRNWEYARSISHHAEYTYPESIEALQVGAKTMLAYYHYLGKGPLPFKRALEKDGLKEVTASAGLDEVESGFVKNTARVAQSNEQRYAQLRQDRAYHDDLYWVSQLFDREWITRSV